MANELRLKVLDSNTDGHNGMRTFKVQVVEVDAEGKETGVSSPVQDYSIDADALTLRHGGDYRVYLQNEVKPRMVDFHRNYQTAQASAPTKDELL